MNDYLKAALILVGCIAGIAVFVYVSIITNGLAFSLLVIALMLAGFYKIILENIRKNRRSEELRKNYEGTMKRYRRE